MPTATTAPKPTTPPAPAATTAPAAPTATTAPAAAATATKAPVAPTAAPVAPTAAPAAVKYSQAPMLADLVKAGKLPALELRLPRQPKVANDMPAALLKAEVGKYGGVMRTLTTSPETDTDVFCFNNEPLVNTPGILGEEITPNILDKFEASADQMTFTFHIREGLKWSDGSPVTTEDVRFAVDDVLLNKELTAAFPLWLRSGYKFDGDPVKLSVVDSYTFKLSYTAAYGGFLLVLAIQGWRQYNDLLKPKAYMSKFHSKYAAPADLAKLVADAGVKDWIQLFTQKDVISLTGNATTKRLLGMPVLWPWVMKTVTPQVTTFERNPYYWKVDSAGNQLPYIDTLQSFQVADVETIDLKNMAGDCDFARSNPKLVKLSLYKENEAKGGYKMRINKFHATACDIHLNLTYTDENWRKVVRDKRFRQALNMAVNRAEIIDTMWYGFGKPATVVPSKLDIAGANALLDTMGMTKKDADGYRLGPDGKTFEVPFETGAQRADMVPTLELIVQHWKKIGIKASIKRIDGSLWTQRNNANQLAATIFWTALPTWYFNDIGASYWAPAWLNWWNSGGKTGEEPTEDWKTLFTMITKMYSVPPAEGLKTWAEVRKYLYDNVFWIVPVEDCYQPLLTNAKMGNIPENQEVFAIGINFDAERFYYKS
jgi:peptide/nickel transport system substrate-binding protein